MKESSKNLIIVLLFIIFVGLIGLLYYSINYQKKLNNDIPVVKEKTSSKELNISMDDGIARIELKEYKNKVEFYFNDRLISTIDGGKISDKNLIDVIRYNEIDYLFVNIIGNDDKPFILNSNGKIIYEFEKINYSFTDDNNNKTLYIDNNSLYIYKHLEEEDKATYSDNEYARKYLVNILEGETKFEFVSIEHGNYN